MISSPAVKILVVEDEAIIAMSIEKDLQELGYEVTVAHSGREAIEVAASMQPDLALMDVVLGGDPDGVEAACRLRRNLSIGSVFLTAYSDMQTFERAANSLPLGYIVKPYVKSELHYTLQLALRRRRVEDLFHACISHLDGNSMAVDRDGTVRACGSNVAALAGVPESRIIDRNIDEVFSVGAGGRWSLEAAAGRLQLLEGEARPLQFTQKPLYARHGAIGGLLTLSRILPTPKAESQETAREQETEEPVEDPVTGLANRRAAEELIRKLWDEGCYVGCFVLERFNVYRQRFGGKAVAEIMLHYGMAIGQHFTGEEQLFHWVGPSFVAVFPQRKAAFEVQHFLSMVACARTEKTLRLPNRTVFVPISCRWTMFESQGDGSPEKMVTRIDSFVASELRRQGL
jgi:CheY-like chemotaxis protein